MKKTRTQLQAELKKTTSELNDRDRQIHKLCADLGAEREATSEVKAKFDLAFAEWKRDRESLVADLTATKIVAKTLAIGQWGDKTDENLQYAVYGDVGGGVTPRTADLKPIIDETAGREE